MRTLSRDTIRAVLFSGGDRRQEQVRITMRQEGFKVPRVFVLPSILSQHVIQRIIAQNVADAYPAGASQISIERVAIFQEVGV
jgi:hypothetical protein